MQKYKTKCYQVAYAYLHGNVINIEDENFTFINNNKFTFTADPFLFFYHSKVYIFAEVYSYFTRRGAIGYSVFENGKFSRWKIIISERYHLSYPFIFTWNGNIYICPESSAAHEIGLYRAVDFPDKWIKDEVLYSGNGKFVDTTLFTTDETIMGYTYCTEDGIDAKKGELRLVEMVNHKLDMKNSVVITKDIAKARCGGKVIYAGDKRYRVAQNCQKYYGHGLVFSKVKNENLHLEEIIKRVFPKDIKICNNKKKIEGVHTYNEECNMCVIDCMYYEWSVLSFIARIWAWLYWRFMKRE